MFLDAVHDYHLFQHVTTPTHYGLNTTANIIDLVLTNEEAPYNIFLVLVPVSMFAFDLIYYVTLLVTNLLSLDIIYAKLILTS